MTTPAAVGSDIGWNSAAGLHSYRDPYTYDELNNYYAGQQPLSFLHPEIARAVQGRLRTLSLNWPRLVVDTLEERLDVEGFRMASDQPADDDLWRIWQANDLDEWSQQCHVEALLHGRAYALVWADEMDAETPRISVESSAQMAVRYAPGTTNITQAIKQWAEDDLVYATVYLPDRVERYVAPQSALMSSADLAVTSGAWELREEPISHDLGQVPVVPFVNKPRLTRPFGESEIADIIPLADAVNKLATDMMVSAEFHAMPRRWAVGIDMGGGQQVERTEAMLKDKYTDAAPGRVWASDSGQAKFGQFTEATLDNFVSGIHLLAGQVAAISGLPPHYVGLISEGNPASADAIRSSEASLVKRARRKQRVFGGSWERVMRLALLVRDGSLPATAPSMETIWRDPETPTVAQRVDAAVKLEQMGMPFRQSLEDLGYSPTQIERIGEMRANDALTAVQAQLEAVDEIVRTYGITRAAALAAVGLEAAATAEAKQRETTFTQGTTGVPDPNALPIPPA